MAILSLSDNHSGTTTFQLIWKSAWLRPLDLAESGGVASSTRRIIPKFANMYFQAASAEVINITQAFDYSAARPVAVVSGASGTASEWGTMEWGIGEWNPQMRIPVRVPLAGNGVAAQFGVQFNVLALFKFNRADVLFKVGRS